MRIGVDLLWVRPKKVGGIESYIRNLLDGFLELEKNYQIVLFTSKDNYSTFASYTADNRFKMVICNVNSANVWKRILWQNFNFGKILKNNGIKVCFEPYYCKPFLGAKRIAFVTTIHDLQAAHYPEYFSKLKVLWMKFMWWSAIMSSEKIVAISKYVKDDIIERYNVTPDKVVVIYNPILIEKEKCLPLETIEKKYGIKEKEYYFTVSSLLPHKNIITLINAMKILKEKYGRNTKLIVSGVGGKSKYQLQKIIKEYSLESTVELTPYIENEERNSLYKYCKVFLFPSLFEGFGMPPVEAMYLGAQVITTRKTSIPEVTQECAVYVENPIDPNEWVEKILHLKRQKQLPDFSKYKIDLIAKQYYTVFENVVYHTKYIETNEE